MDKTFQITNSLSVTYSDKHMAYNTLRVAYGKKCNQAISSYLSLYSRYKNIDDLIENGTNDVIRVISPFLDEAITNFVENDIYDLDLNLFLNNHYKVYFETHWLDEFSRIENQYSQIVLSKEQQDQYRSMRKANRGRIIGGGFGVEGAVKGIATAGAANMLTGLGHSIFNSFGAAAESNKFEAKKRELFNNRETKKILVNAVANVVFCIHFAVVDVLVKNGKQIGNESNPDKAKVLFSNLQRVDDESKKTDIFIKALEASPYYEELYYYAIERYGDANGFIQKMADVFDVNVDEFKKFILEDYAGGLPTETEEQTLSSIEKLKKRAVDLTAKEQPDILLPFKEKLKDFDLKARTVQGKVFKTRDEAALAVNEIQSISEIVGPEIYTNDINVAKTWLDKINALEVKTVIGKRYLRIVQTLFECLENGDIGLWELAGKEKEQCRMGKAVRSFTSRNIREHIKNLYKFAGKKTGTELIICFGGKNNNISQADFVVSTRRIYKKNSSVSICLLDIVKIIACVDAVLILEQSQKTLFRISGDYPPTKEVTILLTALSKVISHGCGKSTEQNKYLAMDSLLSQESLFEKIDVWCASFTKDKKIYCGSNKSDKINGARSYSGENAYIFAIIDSTFFGGAADGMSITDEGIFISTDYNKKSISWAEFSKLSISGDKVEAIKIGDNVYNLLGTSALASNIVDLLRNLQNIYNSYSQPEANSEVRQIPSSSTGITESTCRICTESKSNIKGNNQKAKHIDGAIPLDDNVSEGKKEINAVSVYNRRLLDPSEDEQLAKYEDEELKKIMKANESKNIQSVQKALEAINKAGFRTTTQEKYVQKLEKDQAKFLADIKKYEEGYGSKSGLGKFFKAFFEIIFAVIVIPILMSFGWIGMAFAAFVFFGVIGTWFERKRLNKMSKALKQQAAAKNGD